MKRYIAAILTLLLPLTASACGNSTNSEENHSIVQNMETLHGESGFEEEAEPETESVSIAETEEDAVTANQMNIKVGEVTLTAVLEDNEAAEALKKLLADGPLTISASNYGGFEKVCSLGSSLPTNDSRTTTHAGDICLYNGSQIVIFYGSNSWAYTRLGKVSDMEESELEEILSGEETQITLSLP
ncbi:MAG: cyclophilin-like fold protein [Clostridium sp.]|nr:cyclophilin-like fold protein [Clostridium sp.]